MSFVKNNKGLEGLIDEYSKLLENFENIIKEKRPRSTIYNTKLGKYLKELNNISSMKNENIAKLIGIVNKYNSINHLFNDNKNIYFKNSDILKIIEGQFTFDETNDKSNDTLFELAMAVRFSLSKKIKSSQINMQTNCDIIVDDHIAVECKYIHSSLRINENIKKAIKQVNVRIKNNEAKYGLIALDLTHICQDDEIYKNVYFIFNMFLENHKKLNRKFSDTDILNSVISDENFVRVIHSYISHVLEIKFLEKFDSSKLNEHTKAIIYQSNSFFLFSYKNASIPIPTRALTYYINENLDDKEKQNIIELIHSLAVGI
ncbi:hypothetical protein [Arcobacter sp. LA11]|uniref:hypothetical protein n=1 Tax=Arcobacter sp. LA11 TaxID=1898176 RepID=UPI000933078F|nr:hypothetical protein [Arcobacter sp. LA11]